MEERMKGIKGQRIRKRGRNRGEGSSEGDDRSGV